MENSSLFPITKIAVITGRGGDKICIDFAGPTAHPIMGYDLSATINAEKGTGEEWVKHNVPNMKYEVVKY